MHGLSLVLRSGLTCSFSRSSRQNGTTRKTLVRMSLRYKILCRTERRMDETVQMRCLIVSLLDEFRSLLIGNTISRMLGIPFLPANKRSTCSFRSSVQLSCERTYWHCAFVAHKNDKKKSNSTKVNSSNLTKRGTDSARQKFPCNKCKQLGHWAAAECHQMQQRAGYRGGKSAAKNADAVLMHVMGASRANSVDAGTWHCDSGATRHITQNKQYFVSYTKFANPETIVLGKKNVLMRA